MYVDPSGHKNMISLIGGMTGSKILDGIMGSRGVQILMGLIQRLPSVVTGGVRGLARGAARDAIKFGDNVDMVQMHYILEMAKLYARLGEHSESNGIPIQVYGSNHLPEHQDHIYRSMIGLGSNGRPTPSLLTKKGGDRDDKFLDCALPTATGLCRDEYPYNSTYEGGEKNYHKRLVSVEYVSRSESGRQGNFIKRFYHEVSLNEKDKFLVIPLGPFSGFFDKAGNWYNVPKY